MSKKKKENINSSHISLKTTVPHSDRTFFFLKVRIDFKKENREKGYAIVFCSEVYALEQRGLTKIKDYTMFSTTSCKQRARVIKADLVPLKSDIGCLSGVPVQSKVKKEDLAI